MPFIPHTETDVAQMLDAIGASSIEDLFDEIPAGLRAGELQHVPPGLNEMAVTSLMRRRAAQDANVSVFAGAGAYEHHIPAAVWDLATRSEYYSAYTPYQAEASQGNLQLIYEYQTMMAGLMAMEVSNASLYDGATALAEAALMGVRANRKSKSCRVLVPKTIHPAYRSVLRTMTENQDIEVVEIDYRSEDGTLDKSALDKWAGEDVAVLVIAQPNFLGAFEAVDELVDWAAEQGALSVAVVNPTLTSVICPPGEWGANGADIACGEGQPLGIPLSSGGPYFGFLTCRSKFVRQMPGRVVGRTVDKSGKSGFTLTLQAREQHIRRAKATSNICTNQGLMVTAATIYMSLLGAEGLSRVASASLNNTRRLVEGLTSLPGVERLFAGPHAIDAVVRLPCPAGKVIEAMAQDRIVAGYDLSTFYPELGNALMVSVTETKDDEDIARYLQCMQRALASQ
jgi:glycine dehydrogenase subunit 1